jgi:hypothetical protein
VPTVTSGSTGMFCVSRYEATEAADVSCPAPEADCAVASDGPASRATTAAEKKR